MTIEQIFNHYIDLKSSTIAEQTLRTNKGFFYNHIQPRFGSREIRTLQYIDYQKFANDLLTKLQGKNTKLLKPKTVKNIFIVLKGIYRFAKMNGWYKGDDILQYVELPKFDNRRYFTISSDLQKKYIRAIMDFEEPIYRDIFLFLLHGRRLNEVLDLEWQFLDLTQGIFYLPAKRNKARKNLSFTMTDKQLEVLRPYQLEATDRLGTPFITGHVFLNPNTMKRFNDIRKPWNRLLTNANLPKIRIHDIRHLVATYLINELTIPIEIVSHLLGHSDIKITQKYVNPKPDNAKYAMDSLFDSVKTKGETYGEELNETIKLGECAKEILVSAKKFNKVDICKY